MLKKLFVHEWKDSWRLVTILNLVVLGLTLIGTLFLRSGAWTNMEDNDFIAITVVLYFIFYVISVYSLSFIVSLYFFLRFYRNLYTDQGYLMHTLPVTKHQLIWSKAFVTLIWSLISTIVILLSIFTLADSFMSIENLSLWQEIGVALETAMEIMNGSYVIIILEYILLMFASSCMSIFMGYAAVSLGQLFKKNRILGALGAYIGLYIVMQMLGSYAGIAFSLVGLGNIDFMQNISPETFIMIFILIMLIVIVAVAIAFYFITYKIMKNKLNLE